MKKKKSPAKNLFSAFMEMTKPRISILVLVTAYLGYYLGLRSVGSVGLDWLNIQLLFHLLLGTFLSSSGAAVLNQYIEREYDKKMERTKYRPLPSGIIKPIQALIFGLSLSITGVLYLIIFTNLMTGILSLTTILFYTLIYTPSKRLTIWNTMIGSVPGALPPVGGWVAVTGTLAAPAWILFGILFCWQIPHFLSIAIMYAKDYEKGGFRMLPTVYPHTGHTRYHILFFSIAMAGTSIGLFLIDFVGIVYAVGTAFISLVFLIMVIHNIPFNTRKRALTLMFSSIIYLPALLIMIFLDVML